MIYGTPQNTPSLNRS